MPNGICMALGFLRYNCMHISPHDIPMIFSHNIIIIYPLETHYMAMVSLGIPRYLEPMFIPVFGVRCQLEDTELEKDLSRWHEALVTQLLQRPLRPRDALALLASTRCSDTFRGCGHRGHRQEMGGELRSYMKLTIDYKLYNYIYINILL